MMSQQHFSRLSIRGEAIGLLLIVLLAACAPNSSPVSRPPTTPAAVVAVPPDVYLGDVIDPPIVVQDFALPASTGATLRLSDFDGQWRLLFFGYLHCPDFCPLTLAEYRQVKNLLGTAAAQVEFLYVSMDGVRDTPDALRLYLDNFDPEFIGFSGDDATLARIQPDYGFYYQRRLNDDAQAIYTIDHSTRSYLIDPAGQLRTTFTYDVAPAAIASAIAWYLQQ